MVPEGYLQQRVDGGMCPSVATRRSLSAGRCAAAYPSAYPPTIVQQRTCKAE